MAKYNIGDFISEKTCSPRYSVIWKITDTDLDRKVYRGVCVRNKRERVSSGLADIYIQQEWYIDMDIANKKFYKLNKSEELAILL